MSTRPLRTIEVSAQLSRLISGVMRMTDVPARASRVGSSSDLLQGLDWAIVDTGATPRHWISGGDEIIHVLHATEEQNCRISADGIAMVIHPGDSLSIGANSEIGLSANVLVLHLRSERGLPGSTSSPTHGQERFFGFNRQTTWSTGSHLALERWKLTTPQTIETEHRGTRAIFTLFGNVSCIEDGAIETLGPGDSMVYPQSGPDVNVIPDGLAYIAVIYRPGIDRDDRNPPGPADHTQDQIG